jgi:hypothetical protein
VTARVVVLGVTLACLGIGCATPEVAESYETTSYLPAEIGEALRSDDPARRADAADQVEKMEPATRRKALLELSADRRAGVRLLAVTLLGRLHASEEEVLVRLAGMLALDPDLDVRLAAVDAVEASQRLPALAALVAALTDDPSLIVRRQAAEALDRLTGQTIGAAVAEQVDAAEEAAEEALFAYEEWLEASREGLRWNDAAGRFEGGSQ